MFTAKGLDKTVFICILFLKKYFTVFLESLTEARKWCVPSQNKNLYQIKVFINMVYVFFCFVFFNNFSLQKFVFMLPCHQTSMASFWLSQWFTHNFCLHVWLTNFCKRDVTRFGLLNVTVNLTCNFLSLL